MKRRSVWFLALGLFAACTPVAPVSNGSTASGSAGWSPSQSNPWDGKAPPQIVSEKWMNTADGKPLTWDGLKGKVVLLDLWAFW